VIKQELGVVKKKRRTGKTKVGSRQHPKGRLQALKGQGHSAERGALTLGKNRSLKDVWKKKLGLLQTA